MGNNLTTGKDILDLVNSQLNNGTVSVSIKDFSRTEATKDDTGSIKFTLTFTSGKESESKDYSFTVPKLEGSETVVVPEVEDKDAPKTEIAVDDVDKLLENVFTHEEKEAIKNGADAKVWLEVEVKTAENVNQDDKNAQEEYAKTQRAISENLRSFIPMKAKQQQLFLTVMIKKQEN